MPSLCSRDQSVCLSVCPTPPAQKGAFYGYAYYRTLMATPLLEVECNGMKQQCVSEQRLLLNGILAL